MPQPAQSISPMGSGAMFNAIARRYDFVNRVLSLGLDQSWRRRTVRALELGTGDRRVLDIATGTADLAIAIAQTHKGTTVVGIDPSQGMLEVGRQKIARAKLPITLQEGDAQTLPFEDASFDAVTIAFGIRNVPARLRALREMYRVTKPGGRVAVLELSEPRPGLFGALAKWHVHVLVPFVGGLLSGKREYGYLQASIAAFPPAEVFASTMEEAGLEVLSVTPLTMGVAHLFVAQRARL